MTEAKIKTPVRYDGRARVRDANNYPLLQFERFNYRISDKEFWASCEPIGNQIADALNRQSELEAEVKVLRALFAKCTSIDIDSGGYGDWHLCKTYNGRWYETDDSSVEYASLIEAYQALATADTARGDNDGK